MSAPRAVPVGLVLTGVFSVQIGAALATTLFEDLGPTGAVLMRTAFAAALLAAIWRPRRALLRGEQRGAVVLFGLVLAGMNLSFYAALDRLPLGIAVTIEFIGPLAVAIAASRRWLDGAWIAAAAAGLVLLVPGIGQELDPLGIAFALAAAGFWAAYILLSARVGRGGAGNAGLAMAMAIGAVALVPVGLVGGGTALLEPGLLAIGAAVAVLSSAIPYTAELEALRRLPEGTFGVLLSLEPAVAALVGLVALDQALLGRELAAIGLIVLASAGALSTAPAIDTPET
jgi:inner membrane transporter RhtA